MLVKVSVENFKSFDKAAELTMISSNKIRTNAKSQVKDKKYPVIKICSSLWSKCIWKRPIWHCSLNF